MRENEHSTRPSPLFFGAAGWLFADLLLALAMIFLVANSVGNVRPAPTPTPTPTVTPSPTPIPKLPVLDLHYIVVIVQVDYGALESGDPAAIQSVEQQVRAAPALNGRHAGLVLTFGGSIGGAESDGLQAATAIDTKVLPDLGQQGFVFYGTVYREFFATDKPLGTLELDIYVFK